MNTKPLLLDYTEHRIEHHLAMLSALETDEVLIHLLNKPLPDIVANQLKQTASRVALEELYGIRDILQQPPPTTRWQSFIQLFK